MKFLRETLRQAQKAHLTEIRKFGFVFASIWIGLFYCGIPWLKHRGLGPAPVLFAGLAFLLAAVLAPRALKPVFLAASLVGALLGAVNNRVLLGLVFFFLVVPFAVITRVFARRDALGRRFDAAATTYRVFCRGRDVLKNKEKVF